MTLGHAQFEALFAGLDWRRIHAVDARARVLCGQGNGDDERDSCVRGSPFELPL